MGLREGARGTTQECGSAVFLEEADEIRHHELKYDYAQASALSVDDSASFIAEVLESVT